MTGIVDTLKGIKPLAAGSKLPTGKAVKENNPEKADVDLAEIPGKIVIVGVPGAFTPPCSSHVPGYVEHAEQFMAKGVAGIYVVAVNDAFTTMAWKEKLNASNSKVHFLADDTAAFTTAAGQLFDASGLLGNKRSSRYAAIVNNGTVEKIFVEDEAPSVTVTKADHVLQQI